jgi:hypothetical protein
MPPNWISSKDNAIKVEGALVLDNVRRLLAAIHNLVLNKLYEELVLDFSSCKAVSSSAMLTTCSTVASLAEAGLTTSIALPDDPKMARLFVNTGWANILDPERQPPSRYKSPARVAAVQFRTSAEQNAAVNLLMDAMLSSLWPVERENLSAIEWSLNEITDNVLVHARSPVGGFVQLDLFTRKKEVEFVVADPGIGIPNSLREGHPTLFSDGLALEAAVREGITRDPAIGQGNGLFGSYQVARVSGGRLRIHSGYARLDFDGEELKIKEEAIPLDGCTVSACIDASHPRALAKALQFRGHTERVFDYVEAHFESDSSGAILFNLSQETVSFGSRDAGKPVRTKLLNLIGMNPDTHIKIDFGDAPLLSSSFADEVFGKLFLELGPLAFMQIIQFVNVPDTISALVDRAILQRSKS